MIIAHCTNLNAAAHHHETFEKCAGKRHSPCPLAVANACKFGRLESTSVLTRGTWGGQNAGMSLSTRVPIGDRIRSQRRTAGVTQRALADAVGVSAAYLSLIESDKRQIGGRLLHQIATTLGVEPDAFTAVSDDRLAGDLAEVAQSLSEKAADTAAELVAFSSEWAHLVLELHARAVTAEARAYRLADRFARDPEWTSFAHDILSRITSIRSASEILTDFASLSPRQRNRFMGTIVEESARLTDVARNMIGALQSAAAVDAAGADVREVDAFLQDRDNCFDEIEHAVEAMSADVAAGSPSDRFRAARAAVSADPDVRAAIDGVVSGHRFRTEGAARRGAGALERYAAGALMMPYRPFLSLAADVRYDVDRLGETFSASFEQVAHRMATLRRPGEMGLPIAFLRVDPAGTVSKRRSTAALRLPLFGACPLWIVYQAFASPERTLSQMVDLDGERFLLVARALQKAPWRGANPPARFAVMLGVEAKHADAVVYGDFFATGRESVVTLAGYECHSCRRLACAQRAHASVED